MVLSMYPHMYLSFLSIQSSMDNKRLSWTRKYNNNQFIIASGAYFQQKQRQSGLVSFKSCKLESKTRAKVFGKVDTLEKYQWSDHRNFIFLLRWFSTSLWNSLNFSNISDLCFIKKIYPYLTQIICEGQKITIPAASLNTHRITYISMYYFQ